ncbi:MAG: sarcosine oxidase subunit gamma family protein [Caulobacteraceae bacterium]
MREGVSPPLTALELELAGLAAVCDQGDAYAVFAVTGPAARRVLAKGVPVDIDPAVFGLDSSAATLVAHMGVNLWRADDGFRIAVFRSYAESFRHWLEGAAAEFLTAPG